MSDHLAQSYAAAFFEAATERWLKSLEAVAHQLAGDKGLSERLQTPHVEFALRQPLLDRLLPAEADPPVRNLLYTLMQRGELKLLPAIIDALRSRLRQAQAAPQRAEVVSAMALSPEQRQALAAKLEAQFGPGLDIQYRVDPAILGGLIVRVGDKLIDGSLAARLAAMRQALGVAATEATIQR